MATNKSVTVIRPNGRKPAVIKISPNATMLQILEEACQKFELNPDEYDLKHRNNILDVDTLFRYANISNNASLELVECKNPRKMSDVKISVHLTNGNRVQNNFLPNTNIDNIFKDLNIEYDKETAAVTYMQREICGKDFESVTLKSLGLRSGSALFRLIERTEKLKEQAHVYVPPKSKVSKTEECDNNETRPIPIATSGKNKVLDPITLIKAEKGIIQKQNDTKKEKEVESKVDDNSTKRVTIKNQNIQSNEEDKTPMDVDQDSNKEVHVDEEIKEEIPQIEFLGERNALLFNQAGARAVPQEDIPDSFFELRMDDLKTLRRDSRKKQALLEEIPLLTSKLRELDRQKTTLNNIRKYSKTIIRIQFPNQLVLQGEFKPLETIQTVKDFVKNYLQHPETDFVLYTSPPRCDLNVDICLVEQKLVPSAIIYYSGSSDLKPELKSKLTDPTAASFQAVKTRITTTRKDDASIDDDDTTDFTLLDQPMPVTSSRNEDQSNGVLEPQPGPSRLQSQKSQAPKWFKLSSK